MTLHLCTRSRGDAPNNPGGRERGGRLGGALRDAPYQRIRAGPGAPLRARAAHGRHAAGHVPPPHRLPPPGPALLQVRHHLQHGRVRRATARPPGVVPLLHVERVLQARGHRSEQRARARRERGRLGERVRAVRAAHRARRRRAPVRGRHRARRAHRLQRARLLARVAHARQVARLRHARGQQALLRRRHQQGAAARAHRGRGHRDGRARSHDPHHGRAQGAGAGQGRRGGRQPHVDRLGLPAALAGAVRVRRGRHARAARQDRQVLQGAQRGTPEDDREHACARAARHTLTPCSGDATRCALYART